MNEQKLNISPVDRKPEPNAAGLLPGDEVIDSDLDDSDDELKDEGEGAEEEGEVDIVFCVYDKVCPIFSLIFFFEGRPAPC